MSVGFQVALTIPEVSVAGTPSEKSSDDPAFLRLCHHPIVARVAIVAARAGAERITLLGSDQALERARELLQSERRLRDVELRFGDAIEDEDDLPVIDARADVDVPKEVFQQLSAAKRAMQVPGFPEIANRLEGEPKPLWQGTPPENLYATPIRSRADLKEAKRTIIHHTRSFKPRGPVTRYTNEHISLPLSMLLMDTPVTANQVTAVSAAFVALSAYLLASPSLALMALGGVLLHLSSITDCIDGELARARFTESKFGAWFDVVTDHVTYPLILVGIFIGYQHLAIAEGVAWAPYILQIAVGVIGLTTLCVGGMFFYMHVRRLGIAMTYLVEGIRAAGQDGNVVYKILDGLTALGRRSAITMAFMITTVLAGLGVTAALHFLFFAIMVFVVLANVYLLLGVMHARERKVGA